MTSLKTPVERACDIVGGQSALARKLGIKPQAVQKWVKQKEVPVKRALDVEEATDGLVKAHELCPSYYKQAA
jgi:DNA-binding transcriptional regulator YdaS (Cro superfamily)